MLYLLIFIISIALDLTLGLKFIESPPSKIILAKKGTLSLNCTTEPAEATIEWYYKPFFKNQEYRLSEGGKMKYSEVEREFEGYYFCKAKYGNTTIKSLETELKIAYIDEDFLKVPRQVHTVEGETVEFECTPPASYPPATVTWEKDNRTLTNSRSYIKPDYSLVIVGVLPEDSGKYQCVAVNPIIPTDRRVSLDGELVVTQLPEGTDGEYNSQSPQPSIKSYITVVEEGLPTNLLCGFRGLPYPSYAWYFLNGTAVPLEDNRFSFQYKNQVIVIDQSSRDMAGVFVCEGSNMAGSSVINVTLVVNYTETLAFKEELPEQIVLEQLSNETNVTCKADGSPPVTIKWYTKDDVILSQSASLPINTSQIQNITVLCRARNRDGEITQATNILVKEVKEDSNESEDKNGIPGNNPTSFVECFVDRMVLELRQKDTLPKLHLLDKGCSFESGTKSIETPLNSCGTQVYYNASHIIYKNQVTEDIVEEESSGLISRGGGIHITFECVYQRTGSTGTVEWDAKGKINVEVKGLGTFTFTLDMYTNEDFSNKIDSSQYPVSVTVQDNIYLEVVLVSPDENLSITIIDIIASDSPDGTSGSYKYNIVQGGCIKDSTFKYIDWEIRKSKRFTVKAFHFLNSVSAVYIHTFVKVCNVTEHESCLKVCGNNKRNIDPLAKASRYHIFQGPFIKSSDMKLISNSNKKLMNPTLLLLSFLLIPRRNNYIWLF